MADQNVNGIMQAFDDVRAGLASLRSDVQALTKSLDADQYISAQTITLLSCALEGYRVQAERLESLGTELSIPIENSMSEILDAIRAFEERQSSSHLREMLLDYFRLTADIARYNGLLEESKRALMEKCALSGDRLADVLAPYAMAVDYARSDRTSLTDDQYDAINSVVGERLTAGIEAHNVRYDENLNVEMSAMTKI